VASLLPASNLTTGWRSFPVLNVSLACRKILSAYHGITRADLRLDVRFAAGALGRAVARVQAPKRAVRALNATFRRRAAAGPRFRATARPSTSTGSALDVIVNSDSGSPSN